VNRYLLIAAAVLALAACSKQDSIAASGSPAGPASPASPAAAPTQAPNVGKILQLEQAGPYTYAEVEAADGRRIWIAGGHIEAKAGDKVQWGKGEEMRNFNAKSLGRVFDSILFVNAWGPADGAAVKVAPHGNTAAPHPPMAVPPANAVAPAAGGGANRGDVKTVANAGGYTYLEVQQGSDTVWVAIPEAAIKAGDKVSWDGGMVMQNFSARSLGRVFDRIVFAGGVTVVR
jgi:hypothetical protein